MDDAESHPLAGPLEQEIMVQGWRRATKSWVGQTRPRPSRSVGRLDDEFLQHILGDMKRFAAAVQHEPLSSSAMLPERSSATTMSTRWRTVAFAVDKPRPSQRTVNRARRQPAQLGGWSRVERVMPMMP